MDGKKLKKKNFISPEISQLLYGVDEFFGMLTSSDSHKGAQIKRKAAWEEIARRVNTCLIDKRTGQEV